MRILAALCIAFMAYLPVSSWAAIELVGKQTGSFLGVTTAQTITFALTGGLAAVPAADDLVIVSYAVVNNVDITLSIANTSAVAYSTFAPEQYVNFTYDPNLRIGYRVMPGTPETQVVLSETVTGGTGNVDHPGGYIIEVWRGVNATPLEQAVIQGSATATVLPNPGPITPTTTGTVILVIAAGGSNTAAAYTSGDLTDFRTISITDTFGRTHIGSGHLAWTSGAFDPAVWGTTDNASGAYATNMIALAPAVAASTCNGGMSLLGVGGGC